MVAGDDHARPTGRLTRRMFDPAFDVAAAQVADGTVPFAIVGIADSAGIVRLEAFGPNDGPRIGEHAVCLLASITKPDRRDRGPARGRGRAAGPR